MASSVGVSNAAYYQDWKADPFSRRTYSYVWVGGGHDERELGRPLGKTVFFADEATDAPGSQGMNRITP